MRRELKDMIRDELADLGDVVDGIEKDYANAKAVARAMAQRDPGGAATLKIKCPIRQLDSGEKSSEIKKYYVDIVACCAHHFGRRAAATKCPFPP
jgi:hypothetical protein